MSEGEWRVERNVIDGVPVWELWKPSGHLAVYTRDDLCVANLEDIADAMNAQRRRPMSEAPRDGTQILLLLKGRRAGAYPYTCAVWTGRLWAISQVGNETTYMPEDEIEGWQPLPPPGDAP